MSRSSRTSSTVHLTHRGRALLVLALVALLLAAFSLGRTKSEASTSTERPVLTQVTVQQGETLWAVAQRLAPEADPRQVIEVIRRVNHLEGSTLQVGQQLLLPAAA